MNVAAALQAASIPTARKTGGGLFSRIIAAWLAHNQRILDCQAYRD
ncbi:hypothetical protein [Methylobacterium gnaphalii]|nr:hypothetical protein [Methylobacterium gnaphalii]